MSAELIDGGYRFYAVFDDPSFPLDDSMSDLYPVSILDPTIYYIILAVAAGVLVVLTIRFVVKRKPKAGDDAKKTLLQDGKAPAPVRTNKILPRIFQKEDETDPDRLRRIYRKTAGVLAAAAGITNVAVLTPRELLAALPLKTEDIQEFITTYEYLHYANVSVSLDRIKHLEQLSKLIIEGYYEKNT